MFTATKPPLNLTTHQTLNPSHIKLSFPPSIRATIFQFPPTRTHINGCGGGRMRVRVRGVGGYTKRKLDTEGAYEVVDEGTGERVIVWGGKDDVFDDEKLMASKEMLFWKPERKASGGDEKESSVRNGETTSSSVQGLTWGAGRLKAQKVRNLVRKASREKQEPSRSKYEELDADGDDNNRAMPSDSDDFFMEKKLISSKNGSRPSPQSQMRPKTLVRSSEKSSEVPLSSARAPSSDSDDSFIDSKHTASKNGSGPSSKFQMRTKTLVRSSEKSSEVPSSSDRALSSDSDDSFMDSKHTASKNGSGPSSKSRMRTKTLVRSSEKSSEVPSSSDHAPSSDSDDSFMDSKRTSSKNGSGPSSKSQMRPKTLVGSSEKSSEVPSSSDRALSSDSEDSFMKKKRIPAKSGSKPSPESQIRPKSPLRPAEKFSEISSSFDRALSSDSDDVFMEKKRSASNNGMTPSPVSQMKPKNTRRSSEKFIEVPSSFDRALSAHSDDSLIEAKHITSANCSKASPESKRGPKIPLHSAEMLGEVPSSSSSPPSRGWGGGQGRQSLRDDTEDLKRRSKHSADGGFFSKKSFKDIGCSDEMIESLRGQLFLRPSNIQAMAFAPALQGKSCIIADQSGSGKTLAYLLPIVQHLRQEEVQGISHSFPRNPRAIVLVPTTELASQVLSNCRSLSKFGIPFRSMVATGGFRQKTQLENLDLAIDVLIATPGRFLHLIKEGFLELTNLRCVVLDEVDILYSDEGFELALQSLTTSAMVSTQYLFVTATLPLDVYYKLVEVFPDVEVIMGPGVHRTSSALEEVLVDCSGDEGAEKSPETAFTNKKTALLKIAEESSVPKTIVFCNKIETCRKVENALSRFDRRGRQIRVIPFHAALAQEKRLANMKEFLAPQSGDESQFLICTDRASRGIDFEKVDHVILFDFPRDPSEYVRRVGRTARGAGGRGKAFVFVVGKQVSLARRIMARNLKGHPLHEVPASFELMPR
ncbi:hypothetical protein Droror1_Dr00009674 [Drosera rotundifolia]